MATDKKRLEENIKRATLRIANNEFLRITAKNEFDETCAIDFKEIWQETLIDLEQQYRKLKEE